MIEREGATEIARAEAPSSGGAERAAGARSSALGLRLARPQSPEEAEKRYVAARDAWIAAMRAASSGRSADLAALAIAQEAFEAASAERERWASAPRVAIPVESERPKGIDAIVGQELAWRQLHANDSDSHRGLRGLLRRLTGR